MLRRSPAFDGGDLRKMLCELAGPDELVVLFWGNLMVPSVAVEAGLVAAHADVVLADCYECWVYLVDNGVLIEFQDGEGFTVGRVPQ